MSKFHINKKGVPSPCRATKGKCPLGGEGSHFDSKEAAQKAADELMEKEYGIIGGGNGGGPPKPPKDVISKETKEFLATRVIVNTIVNLNSRGYFKTKADERKFKSLDNYGLQQDVANLIGSKDEYTDEEVKEKVKELVNNRMSGLSQKRVDEVAEHIVTIKKFNEISDSEEEAIEKLEDHYINEAFEKAIGSYKTKTEFTDAQLKDIGSQVSYYTTSHELGKQEDEFKSYRRFTFNPRDDSTRETRNIAYYIARAVHNNKVLNEVLTARREGDEKAGINRVSKIREKIKNKIVEVLRSKEK